MVLSSIKATAPPTNILVLKSTVITWSRVSSPKLGKCFTPKMQWATLTLNTSALFRTISDWILTSIDRTWVGNHPLWKRQTKEEREAKDEEIARRVHVHVL